jgi:hypothetical protein
MMKGCLITLFLVLPSLAYSQAIPFEQRGPVASITESASYIYGESQNGHNYSLWGWSAVPEVQLAGHIGLQADFASYYMRSIYPGQSRLLMAAGPRYTFAPRSRVTPFVFAEGGEMRLSAQRTLATDWNTVVKGGIGLEYRVSRSVALTLVPGEYLGHQLDSGSWDQDFTTRGGITFNLFR